MKRRPDRLEKLEEELKEKGWCFKDINIFEAVDGTKVPTPPGFKEGGGAWGCLQSHRQILEKAIMDDVRNLLVLEDDLCFKSTYIKDLEQFLNNVPDNWDQLMVGGQHLSSPIPVSNNIVKCTNCQRTHAYGIRGRFMRELYAKWCSPLIRVHCDWVMGPLQRDFNVYAPDPFVFGQTMSQSDINGRLNPTKFWQPPVGNEPVIILKCSREIVEKLREHGVHTGYRRDSITDVDVGLLDIFKEKPPNETRFRRWVDELMWEVVSEENYILGVWYLGVENQLLQLLNKCWKGKIYTIETSSLETALYLLKQYKKNISHSKILL